MVGCNFAGPGDTPWMHWDDLRIARAIYQTGSFAAAATRLRINETTVARRLRRLEEDVGVTLFEAADGARRPTAACEELVAVAGTMAGQVEQLEHIASAGRGLAGRRRIATTESIASGVLAPGVPAFLAKHPGLMLDLMASAQNVNFSRWEADLAVRMAKPDKGDFVIRKLTDLVFYLLEPVSTTSDLVCCYPDDLSGTPEMRFLAGTGLTARARVTTRTLPAMRKMVETGACAGVLPSFLCRDLLDDDAFRAQRLPQTREIWLLVQPHLKDDAATRAVIDWIRSCFAAAD